MNVDYGVIAAIAALIAAFAAVVAIWVEGRRSRFSQGLDILLKMSAEWDAEDFRNKRRTFAKCLLQSTADRQAGALCESLIIDHFQRIGLLLRKGIMDKQLVHSDYFYWWRYYYVISRATIEQHRQARPTVWEDAVWLYKELVAFQRKYQRGAEYVEPDEEQIRAFLVEESMI